MAGSLDGIRILDLTTIYSGPIAASILGDQGADVVKVESPQGDFMRHPGMSQRNGVGGAFAMMNRNKRSIVIDLGTDDGKGVFKRLVESADVVMENYRPGVVERLGIGYETLKAINPRLVFASINGVGHTGPYAGRRVYDAIVQSISGIGSLQADPASERPLLINSLICDKITSMTAAQAIASALVARERSGVGQRVDVAMLDAALFFLWPDNMLNYTFVGDEEPHSGRRSHEGMVRKTRDGYICTMPVQAAEWHGLFRALELPNLFEDERFRTQAAWIPSASRRLWTRPTPASTRTNSPRGWRNSRCRCEDQSARRRGRRSASAGNGGAMGVRASDSRRDAPSPPASAVRGDASGDLPLLAGTRRAHP